jgi:UDP-N-acetylglucosamine acyltransferase
VRISRYPASYIGVNTVGLRRKGFSSTDIRNIQDIYHQLFVEHRNISKGIKYIEENLEDTQARQRIIDFTRASKNGVIKGLIKKRKTDDAPL